MGAPQGSYEACTDHPEALGPCPHHPRLDHILARVHLMPATMGVFRHGVAPISPRQGSVPRSFSTETRVPGPVPGAPRILEPYRPPQSPKTDGLGTQQSPSVRQSRADTLESIHRISVRLFENAPTGRRILLLVDTRKI